MTRCLPLLVLFITLGSLVDPHGSIGADDFSLLSFDKHVLSETFFGEGAAQGDLNQDGHGDVVSGPYWYAGPDFKKKSELDAVKPFDPKGYSDNFFTFVDDINGDSWLDVLVYGFPGKEAFWYENPGNEKNRAHWPRHLALDTVDNESPAWTDLTGDGKPEIVCSQGGFFGFASPDRGDPTQPWKFRRISRQAAGGRFTHALGVGDVDGDGRMDLLEKNGWWQQPKKLEGDPQWEFRPFQFAGPGGSQMYVYDVDGDGDNDVITGLAAHAWGLVWYEHKPAKDAPGGIGFEQHLILNPNDKPNEYGVAFSQLHAIELIDMDGDGLKDIVTGKRYWAHNGHDPGGNQPAVLYWFKLMRDGKGADNVRFVPIKIDDDSGVGTQVQVADVNGDKLPDIVVGNKKGTFVHLQQRQRVSKKEFDAAMPKKAKALQAGLPPAEAAKAMTVPEGFRVQLAAGEPQIHQPIAMAFDHRGRLWVAEGYTYPIRAPEGAGKDKIVILEDTDLDGTLDSRKVFIEGLNLVSGLEVGFGGVWVGAPPYLLFIPDEDGDDQPDAEPRVLLDGFGFQDTHETLNSFIWGPDGWLYGCHGVFTHSRVGKPGTPDAERTALNAGVWRYHPLRHEFDVFARGSSNPWGVDFNDRGQAFITACVIPHLFHVIQGARYRRQAGQHFNPHVYDDIKTIADHVHYIGNIRDHAWWGHEPIVPNDTSAAGGGHAHCGAMVYLGDNWPDEHRNHIFFNNIHGNRVNNDLLEREGSGYVGHHGKDLLLANDRWFRGINLRYGPDGSVYLIDWYDKNACHRRTPEIWDRTNGRIYRVVYGDTKPKKVDLSKLSNKELTALQSHKNDWYGRTARRILQQRGQDSNVHQMLSEVINSSESPPTRLKALWTLHVTDGFSEVDALSRLDDPDEYIRAWTIQLQLEDGEVSKTFLDRMKQLAVKDPSPVVRLYLASALQRLPNGERWPIAEALASHEEDSQDHNLPLMYWYGIEPLVQDDPARALELSLSTEVPLISQYLIRRAANDIKAIEQVAELLTTVKSVEQELAILNEMQRAFEGRVGIPMPQAWTAAYEKLTTSESAEVRDRADQVAIILGDKRIFPRMRQRLMDSKSGLTQRRQALEILVRGRDPDAASAFQAVLKDPGLRAAAIRALAALDDPGTPTVVLAEYQKLNENERRDAIGTLVARPRYAHALLTAIESKVVPRTDLHAFHIRQLLRFENESLNDRIKQVWGEVRPSSQDKQQLIARYRTTLTAKNSHVPNLSNGRRIFSKACGSCHVLFGEGGKVGPELTGSNRANLDYLLENILDPSAVLGKDYRMSVLALADGRIVSGLVQKETESALTVRTINDTVVIAKADIDDRQLSDNSLMPDGLLDQMKPEETRDLAAYLASPTQVAITGPPAPIDAKTGQVPGAIEGESMKILEKTHGSAASQKMGNFTADRWSRGDQLWWTGAKPGSRLVLELPVEKDGPYGIEVVMTRARDYGIVQLKLDGEKLGDPVDLFNAPNVVTTGVITILARKLTKGKHRLGVEILGANPNAAKAFMFGLDYVRLTPE